MKPLLIKVDKDGNLKITLDELQKMVDESYQHGYDDGYTAGQKSMQITWQGNTVPKINSPNWFTTAPSEWDARKYEVTCTCDNK